MRVKVCCRANLNAVKANLGFALSVLLSMTPLLVSLSVSSMAAAPPVPAKLKLALNWKPEPQFGGFYAAQAGLKAAGNHTPIELEIVPGGAGTPVVQMVAAGKFDFGISSADEVILSRAKGSDVVALFAVYQTNPQGIMTRADRGFQSLADVFASEGTIAMQKGLAYSIFLTKKYGVQTRSSKGAALVPYVGGISNFLADKKHSQQCFVTSEPLLARKAGVKVKTFLVAESGYNPYTTVVISRRSYVEKNKELTKALIAGIRQGWTEYLGNSKVMTQVNSRMFELNPSIDVDTLKASCEAQRSLIDPALVSGSHGSSLQIGQMEESRWSQLGEQMKEMGLVSQVPEAARLFSNY